MFESNFDISLSQEQITCDVDTIFDLRGHSEEIRS